MSREERRARRWNTVAAGSDCSRTRFKNKTRIDVSGNVSEASHARDCIGDDENIDDDDGGGGGGGGGGVGPFPKVFEVSAMAE